MRATTYLIFLLVLFTGQSVFGTTWYVEKDGSGDFTVIQHAVNAASEGDVIAIGPGRFDDYTTDGNWDLYVNIPEKSLTLRGSGIGETIIGPSEPEANTNYAAGIVSIHHPDHLRIENLTVENINRVAIENSASTFEFENCRVVECTKIVQAYDCDGLVRNCSFSSCMYGLLFLSLTGELAVENSGFEDVNFGVMIQGSVAPFTIRNCDFITEESFYSSQYGIQISHGAIGEISDCNVQGYAGAGIVIAWWAQVSVHDCSFFQQGGVGLHMGDATAIQFHDNILISDIACIRIGGASLNGFDSTALHNNHILREGDGLFVENWTGGTWGTPTEYFDMTNNFWGTQDLDEISAYIEDGYSMPSVDYFVVFDPIADGPVPTQRLNLEDIKALYRDVTR